MPGQRARTEVVLFDFFGTLVTYESDRTALAYPSTHALLQRWGQHMTHDEFIRLWDETSAELEATIASSHREASMLDYAYAFSALCPRRLSVAQCESLAEEFAREWQAHVRRLPAAASLIDDLRTSYRLAVVSNTNDTHMVPRLLSELFAPGSFHCVVLSVEHGYRKPHPSIYRAALTAVGCDASSAVFVGDSYEADYLGPRAAGMRAFLIDPLRRHPMVPENDRLDRVEDLRSRLG